MEDLSQSTTSQLPSVKVMINKCLMKHTEYLHCYQMYHFYKISFQNAPYIRRTLYLYNIPILRSKSQLSQHHAVCLWTIFEPLSASYIRPQTSWHSWHCDKTDVISDNRDTWQSLLVFINHKYLSTCMASELINKSAYREVYPTYLYTHRYFTIFIIFFIFKCPSNYLCPLLISNLFWIIKKISKVI